MSAESGDSESGDVEWCRADRGWLLSTTGGVAVVSM